MMTDIHTHEPQFKVGQKTILSLQLHPDSRMETLLNGVQPGMLLSAGIHPWHASEWLNANIPMVEAFLSSSQVVLIGEIGLDKACGIPLDAQLQAIEIQLDIAEELSKPVLIHNVGHQSELLALKRKYQRIPAWILHGFRGKSEAAETYLRSGFYLSFGQKFQPEALCACPLNRLFLETDESDVKLAALYQTVSQLRGLAVGELEDSISHNFNLIFGE